MSKFCTKCGRPLEEGEQCSCTPKSPGILSSCKSAVETLAKRMGIWESHDANVDIFETNKNIVPDVVKANDGEVPIKQYEVATLRSRIRGQYTKGRLQVTNKRVLFRAAGASYKGAITVQHEFALEEIAGIEVKISNRVSPLNIFLGIILSLLVCPVFSGLFERFSQQSEGLALFTSIVIAVVFALPFFLLKKKFWVKFLLLDCGIGCLIGTSSLASLSPSTLIFGIQSNVADVVGFIFSLLWLLNLILVALVPDLVLCVKTKGAAEAFNIRRKQHATIFKQEVEYTGFSEVVPSKDASLVANELGALIDDLQKNGYLAIENWKEQ